MASPALLGGAGIGGAGIGSLLSASGALQSGAASSASYGYQAGVARLNSQIALQNRDYAIATGDTEAQKYGYQAAQRMGAIKAGEGASGIDVGSGSKLAVQEGQQFTTNIDMAQIRNNAARKAYGYEVEASQDTAQAGLLDRASSDASSAGYLKAAGSLVSGVTSVSDKWLQASNTGLFNNTGRNFNPDNSNYYVS